MTDRPKRERRDLPPLRDGNSFFLVALGGLLLADPDEALPWWSADLTVVIDISLLLV